MQSVIDGGVLPHGKKQCFARPSKSSHAHFCASTPKVADYWYSTSVDLKCLSF